MVHRFFCAPAGTKVGLTSVTLGLVRALDKHGIRVGFFKPISQPAMEGEGLDRSTHFIESTMGLKPAEPMTMNEVEGFLQKDQLEPLMEQIVTRFEESTREADVVVIEGLVGTGSESTYAARLNASLAKALSAQIILVGSLEHGNLQELDDDLKVAAAGFGGSRSSDVLGCVINKVNVLPDGSIDKVHFKPVVEDDMPKHVHNLPISEADDSATQFIARSLSVVEPGEFDLVGMIPWRRELLSRRVSDLVRELKAEVIIAGEMEKRRVQSIALCARTIPFMLGALRPNTLLISSSDRYDVLLAATVATINKVPLAGILFTGEYPVDDRMMQFCHFATDSGLPIMRVSPRSYQTAIMIYQLSDEIPLDDPERIEMAMDYVAQRFDAEWLATQCRRSFEQRLSPAAFRYQLVKLAQEANKKIILPEGEEPRTIQAAHICQQRGIANCLLVGEANAIQRVAEAQGIQLHPDIVIINPDEVRERYVEPLMEFRKHKKLAANQAMEALQDNIMLGTVMLALGEVDGLVSGAIHSSANTVRPALQIIKTRPGAQVVSSIFFMCLPDQVVVYGDCAVVPDPDIETLADIAIQSADSAGRFGIPPRVAMISYSTGESGSGADVDKVRRATELAKKLRPDLLIDGPLQYDAAAIPEVAAQKAPQSPVAGKATVFVFPDLNTGNTTYKAVQRSANVVSIGPMLQGLKKPVNDLSRGAWVEDIIYTIALTAIQAREDRSGA